MAANEKQFELTEHLNRIIEEGAGLDEIMAALDEAGALNEDKQPRDDMERPVVDRDDLPRGYWNIRDASGDDPAKARDLAEWACRKHKAAEDAIADIEETGERQIAQVRAWVQEGTKKLQHRAEFFEGVLDLYQQDFAPEDKTTKLVSGQIVRRKRPAELVRDEAAELAWAMQRPDVDELAPRRLSVSAVNAVLTKQPDGTFTDENGQIVDFQHEQAPQIPYTFTVKH